MKNRFRFRRNFLLLFSTFQLKWKLFHIYRTFLRGLGKNLFFLECSVIFCATCIGQSWLAICCLIFLKFSSLLIISSETHILDLQLEYGRFSSLLYIYQQQRSFFTNLFCIIYRSILEHYQIITQLDAYSSDAYFNFEVHHR